MPRGEPRDLPAGNAGLIFPENGTVPAKTQGRYRHHANAERRRPKTLGELHAGCEFVEVYDRRFPGRMAARCRR